jgi:hypothetical protein
MRQMHSGEEEFVQETELLPGRSLDTNLLLPAPLG